MTLHNFCGCLYPCKCHKIKFPVRKVVLPKIANVFDLEQANFIGYSLDFHHLEKRVEYYPTGLICLKLFWMCVCHSSDYI